MDEVAEMAAMIAEQQARMDAAVAGAAEPAARAKLAEIAAEFRETAGGFLEAARAKAAETAAILASLKDPAAEPPPESPPAPPAAPADADPLADYLAADWFAGFGHHEHSPDLD